jgi:hypothetical protein
MWILMNTETADRIRGMYNGSLFEPILVIGGYACSVDNLSNPAFAEIHEELSKCEIVESVEYPEASDE